METMLRQIFAALLLALSGVLAATASAAPKVEWHVETTEDKEANPHSTLDLVIDGRQVVHVVSPAMIMQYTVLAREDYEAHHIPAKALCACAGWWAGAGENYYVVSAGEGKLELFRQAVDEESPASRYKKERTIKIEAP